MSTEKEVQECIDLGNAAHMAYEDLAELEYSRFNWNDEPSNAVMMSTIAWAILNGAYAIASAIRSLKE